MRNARKYLLALVPLVAPLVACAAGSMSPDVGPAAVTPESDSTDSGTIVSDTGPVSAPLPPVTNDAGSGPSSNADTGTAPGDDAASPPSGDANAALNDDAATASEDSGAPPPPPPVDSGTPATCPGYAPPTTPANCTCSAYAAETCTANNCYNGYYCELADDKCVKKPLGC